jgi:antitoxin protein of toxin-antitoxin system
MSIIDKVKELLGQHSDKAEQGIDKAGDVINDKTGGKYSDKIESAQDKAKDMLGKEPRQGDQPGQGPTPG